MADWTEQQNDAIMDRQHDLLVAAAAGSGKTAVLVERIICLVRQDRIDIDRMLIVTFTQAAAGEMRSRISTALLQAMEEDMESLEFLRQQVTLLNRAAISTLHSFCMDVVRRYFHMVGISPSFRVGNATEMALLKLEVIEELFDSEYEQGNADFLDLVEMYAGGKDDTPLRDLVLRTYDFIQSQPYPLPWLRQKMEDFNLAPGQFNNCRWVQSLMEQIDIELAGIDAIFREAETIAARPGGPSVYLDTLHDDLSIVRELRAKLKLGFVEFYRQLSLVRHKTLARVDKGTENVLKETVQQLRDQGKKVIKELATKMLIMSPDEFCHDLQAMYPGMLCLYRLVQGFDQSYRELKSEKGLVDFDDLEHYALEILADPLAAGEYRSQFHYIFVDEYQDSNLVQETILNFIKRENNLFMVGDVKQSIYRFRLADPSLFLNKYETYNQDDNQLTRRIDLSSNYRSRKSIIAGVNDIFNHIMTRQFGEMDYDQDVFLQYGLQLPNNINEELDTESIELILIDKKSHDRRQGSEEETGDENDAQPEDTEEPLGDIEFEAKVAAARINELHGQIFYDSKKQTYRRLDYRDIVVLLRATRQQADTYYETLMGAGIPVYADVDRGYFETTEVAVFINLLRLIDNKRQDIPLLSVLRSPIAGFTVEELIVIRADCPASDYFEALHHYVAIHDDILALRLGCFLQHLDQWKEEARFSPMDEFIWQLLLETGYLYYVSAMPGGLQRQANLRILLERAQQYQQSGMKGLFHFLKFIEKLESSSSDMGMAKLMGENEDVVRIMSVHKSKGLEFPVVIMAGLGRKFNLSDTKAKVMFHKDLGVGPRFVDPELRITRDTIARIALKNRILAENLAEEMRILYVACTRPRDKLILVGTAGDLTNRIKKWIKGTGPFQISRGNSLLDWIGAVVVLHADGKILTDQDPIHSSDSKSRASYQWKIRVVEKSEHGMALSAAQTDNGFEQRLQDYFKSSTLDLKDAIWTRLDWTYRYPDATNIPSKISVSQIKELQSNKNVSRLLGSVSISSEPRFVSVSSGASEVLSGAAKGTILHAVMQHLDLNRVDSEVDIEQQLQDLVTREILLPKEAESVDRQKIMRFFGSALGQRVLASPWKEREVPFNLIYDAARIFSDRQLEGENLLVQGIIDLFFQEGNALVLVDYKTDRITPLNRDELIDNYRIQLELYKSALEKILTQRVKESYLYLFDVDEAVRLDI